MVLLEKKNEITDVKLLQDIKDLIVASEFELKTNKEQSVGWHVGGVNVIIDGELYWFMEEGVNGNDYIDVDFFEKLLNNILDYNEIDYVIEYLDNK